MNNLNAFANITIDRVADFWDRRPCNVRHSPKPVGTREYFDEVESRKYFVEPHIPRFADFPRWRGKRVLEIGCGIGTDTINFARAGAAVTAVDLSERSLDIARARADVFGLAGRIRFHHGSAESLADFLPVEPYDLIYSFGVIHHTPNPPRVLEQLRRFVHPRTTLKLMLYHRYAWKVLALVLTTGRGRFWKLDDVVAAHSEAQTGCPVTYTYSRRSARRLVEAHGFRVTGLFVDHIFPYRIADYVEYRYVEPWYLAPVPAGLFRAFERRLGWHVCLTAMPAHSAENDVRRRADTPR